PPTPPPPPVFIDSATTEKSIRSMHAKLKDVLPKRQRG
ncbi:hypothetical protein, partial [Pseudomonas aeruginosa]